MYRRSKFIEILHEIRQEMAAEADYDVVLFAEMVRSGEASAPATEHTLNQDDTERRPQKARLTRK